MYVRDARNREEVWLLDHIEAMGLDESAFRSRDYVVAIDEESGEKAGFGRIRLHGGEEDICELTSIGVLDGWRRQGVGAHVVERLIEYAGDQGFTEVYTLAPNPEYFEQFGFTPIDDDAVPPHLDSRLDAKQEEDAAVVPLRVEVDAFSMPDRLRETFKRAGKTSTPEEDPDASEAAAAAEEFGIDPEEATYKYDTRGRRRE